MRIPAIHEHMLPCDMRCLRGDEKQHHRSDLSRLRHPLTQRYFRDDIRKFRFGIRKCADPLLVKWRTHFSRDQGIYAYAARKQLRRPIPRKRKYRSLSGSISRSAALPRDGHLRRDVQNAALRFLQRGQSEVRHVVVVKKIEPERTHKFFGGAVLESNIVIRADIVYENIQPPVLPKSLLDGHAAIFHRQHIRTDKAASCACDHQLSLKSLPC